MKTFLLISVFLVVCTLSYGHIGKSCNKDDECENNKMVCQSGTCKCGVAFREGNQKDCISIAGSNCESSDECSNLPGAVCKDYKCVCPAGLIAGAKECNKVGEEGDECTLSADCIHRVSPPDDNRECRENKCTCRLNMHFGSDGKCKPTKMLRDICSLPDDCFQADSNNNNALECTAEGACQCKQGYIEEQDKCNVGATKFILSSATLLLIIMAVLKI